MTPDDRRFMIEARDAYLASRPLTPEHKDRWKSVFARHPASFTLCSATPRTRPARSRSRSQRDRKDF
jgi:hypothetical protein